MHEISLLENVREILQDHAEQQNFKRVKKITLVIGQLSCIEPDALRFAFDAVMQDSLAEGAELTLRQLAGQGKCNACQQIVVMHELYDSCELCAHPFVTVTGGNDMTIQDLIVI